ncbi:MAG TPA: tetratricopeptide repeat protein [bacterium]|nr:tetratricopeptide repeat protein [bacterium]
MGRHSDGRTDHEALQATLGQRIRDARRALGLTQEALGRPDFTKGFISLLEHDRAKPSVASLGRLAARLRRPVSYFLDGDESLVSARLLDALRGRGRAELARRSFEPALRTFEELRKAASDVCDPAAELHAVLGAGEALFGLGRIDEAWADLQRAHERARQAGNAIVVCRAAHRLGEIELRGGRYAQAVTSSRSALDAARGLGAAEIPLRGEIHLVLGTALFRLGRLDEAAQSYREARTAFDEAAQPHRAGEALYGLGDALSKEGDHAGALLQFERARSLFEQHEAARSLSQAHDHNGALLMRMGRPAEAAEHFTASLALNERLRDIPGECRVLTEFARCLHACGDPAGAKTLAERAAARSREAGLLEEEARAHAVLGTLAAAAGDLREAQRALASAARYCEDSGMTLELVPIYQELARVAGLAGRYKDASGYHERAFRLLQTMRPVDIAAAVQPAEPSTAGNTPAQESPPAGDA